MTTLERLDRIKTNLQIAKQSLHEADNWSVLANEVEEVTDRLNFLTVYLRLCTCNTVSYRFLSLAILKILLASCSACRNHCQCW